MHGRLIGKIRLPLSILLPAAPWWTVIAAGLMAAGLGFVRVRPHDIVQIAGLYGLSLGALIVLCSPIYAVASPVQISTDGIASYNAWDRRTLDFMPWSAIFEVDECRILSVRYIRLRGRDQTVLRIPRGLVQSRNFQAAVREAAPIDNALRSYLDRQPLGSTNP